MSSDTMNSCFQACAYVIENFKNIEDELTKEIYANLNTFAKLTHTIGNFTLIPYIKLASKRSEVSFNQWRGINLGDHFDLSLQYLKVNKGYDYFKEYSKKFKLDLNLYVDEKYNVKSLLTGKNLSEDEMKLATLNYKYIEKGKEKTLKRLAYKTRFILAKTTPEQFNEYLKNMNTLIRKRGLNLLTSKTQENTKI